MPVEHNDSEFRRIMRFRPTVFHGSFETRLYLIDFSLRKTHFGAKMKLFSTFLGSAIAGVQYVPAVQKADESCM